MLRLHPLALAVALAGCASAQPSPTPSSDLPTLTAETTPVATVYTLSRDGRPAAVLTVLPGGWARLAIADGDRTRVLDLAPERAAVVLDQMHRAAGYEPAPEPPPTLRA